MEDTLIQLGGDLKEALKLTGILVITSGLLLLFVGTVILPFAVMTLMEVNPWVATPVGILWLVFGVVYVSVKIANRIS